MIDTTFLAAPVLAEGKTTVDVYLPQAAWFDYTNLTRVTNASDPAQEHNDYPAPLNHTIPLFMRGGSLIPKSDTQNVRRSDDIDNHYELVIAAK